MRSTTASIDWPGSVRTFNTAHAVAGMTLNCFPRCRTVGEMPLRSTALKTGIEDLGMTRHQPSHSPLSTSFFVGGRDEHDVSRRVLRRFGEQPLREKHHHEIGGQHPFVVDRAAPVEVTVGDITGEWIVGPPGP